MKSMTADCHQDDDPLTAPSPENSPNKTGTRRAGCHQPHSNTDVDTGAEIDVEPQAEFPLAQQELTDITPQISKQVLSEQLLSEQASLPLTDAEHPEGTPQIELAGMSKPVHTITLGQQALSFQHAHTLLESLESHQVEVHYQCREGYCGSCRAQLISGDVHYTEPPLAWLNEGEILPCCCIPKSDINIKLN